MQWNTDVIFNSYVSGIYYADVCKVIHALPVNHGFDCSPDEFWDITYNISSNNLKIHPTTGFLFSIK